MKMLSILKTGIESNFVKLKKPYKLNFAITYRCNSRCLTCNIWKMKPIGELTIEEIREFARKNNYFKWLEITGGEPLLRSDIVEIVKTFYENSKNLYLVTMPTNALVNHDFAIRKIKEILEIGIPRFVITISLDGYRELNDKIRGVDGDFDKAIDLYKRLMELKKTYKNLDFAFGYTISDLNKGQFEKTFEAVKNEIPQITYNDFHINLAQTSSNYYNDNEDLNIKPSGIEVADEIEAIIKKRKRKLNAIDIIEHAFLKGLVYFAKTGKMPIHSRSLEASLFLDSFGNVYPSIMWNEKIGNIRETQYDLRPLLESEKAKMIYESIKQGKEPQEWTACEIYQSIIGDFADVLLKGYLF